MENAYLFGLFPVPILEYTVSKEIADNAEKIFLEKESLLKKMDHCYGDFYSEKIIDLEKDIPDLLKKILECKDNFFNATGINTSGYIQSWTQDYKDEGQNHPKHNHGINGISGVYWIRANDNASELCFYNPNKLIDYISYSQKTPFNFPSHKIKPQKGKIVLFPSYLDHEVMPSPANTIRTTIAFNFPLMPVHIKGQ